MNRKFSVLPLISVILITLAGCGGSGHPDVSHIKVKMDVLRFDSAVFAADTAQPQQALLQLKQRYPSFTNDFSQYILGIGPVSDTMPPQAAQAFQFFLTSYRPVYDSLAATRKAWDKTQPALMEAFRHLKYYFPDYAVPEVVVYVGPFDAPGVALTENAMAIGLQLYGGKDFFFYKTMQGQAMFPEYISRRFEPAYIPVNAMKAVLDDMYPIDPNESSLLEKIVSSGKQLYMLDLLLPATPDSLKTGYTADQLAFCRENEGAIWNVLLKTTDIYTLDQSMIRIFVGDAPSTEVLGPNSPGNIGQFVGWKMVQKYMSKFPEIKPDSLMRIGAKDLFLQSGYKPK